MFAGISTGIWDQIYSGNLQWRFHTIGRSDLQTTPGMGQGHP